MQRKFSIRYKFLTVTTLLLAFCVIAYLLMATTVIHSDKTNLVFDYNRSLVSNISSDVQSLFESASDKMRLVAYFYRENDEQSLKLIQSLIADSQEIAFVSGSDTFESLSKVFYMDKTYLETYELPSVYFEKDLVKEKPIPFERIQREGVALWNATTQTGPALIGYGKSVVEESTSGKVLGHYAVISFIKADKILEALTTGDYNRVFLANKYGDVLVHPDPALMRAGADEISELMIDQALRTPVRTGVLQFAVQGKDHLGGFSKSLDGQLSVISHVSGKKAFSVVNELLVQSLLFALIVATLAFIAAILFSRSLTRPIDTLVGGMKKVSEGDLETQIFVNSKDEIQMLAKSFNSMIYDLKKSREELEEINRNLEEKVKERTVQLEKQNQAVKSAQEALLRTTRLAAVGEIAGRAAHEVLNPLTSILSRVQNVKVRLERHRMSEANLLGEITESWRNDYAKGGFEEVVRAWKEPSQLKAESIIWDEDLENIESIRANLQLEWKTLMHDADFLIRESERISRIVQSMRSLSIVKSEKRKHNLKGLLEEAVNIMADLASKEGVMIVLSDPDPELIVSLDKDEFLQGITNMIRNSIQSIVELKFQGNVSEGFRGLIQVNVSLRGDVIEIRIEDNGIGIAEKHRGRLFDTQFTTKPREKGTGLGLNISRRFIRAFNGDIYLESSEEGKGSVFVVTLPNLANEQKVSA